MATIERTLPSVSTMFAMCAMQMSMSCRLMSALPALKGYRESMEKFHATGPAHKWLCIHLTFSEGRSVWGKKPSARLERNSRKIPKGIPTRHISVCKCSFSFILAWFSSQYFANLAKYSSTTRSRSRLRFLSHRCCSTRLIKRPPPAYAQNV